MRPSKRLGQNFVIEPGTVRRIAALAALEPRDVVLEVGPGLGSLTLALLEAGAGQVVAVEIDPVLAAELPRTVAARAPGLAGRVAVVAADALRIEAATCRPRRRCWWRTCRTTWRCRCCCTCWPALPSLRRGLVMVQAEVADRMCAAPGSRVYGAPSVKLAWFAAARPAGPVPRSVFWPVPNVDSRLVAFTRRDPPETAASREEVFAVVDAAFRQRRKTLRAALSGWAGSAPEAETAAPGGRHRPGRPRGIARRRRVRAAGGGPEISSQQSAPPAAPRTISPS